MSTSASHDPTLEPTDAPATEPGAPERSDALTPGTRLDGLQIERVISSSGFSFVYQARDLALEYSIALKEYLPSAIARREEHRVVARSAAHVHAFEQGKRAFMQETQMLARCDHPALVRVTRLWTSHGTAYRTMPLYTGRPLLAVRHAMTSPPDETWLGTLLDDLLGALETVHEAGYVHRRVLPANILVRPNGRPVLMDFDAVRHTLMSDKAQSLMAAIDPTVVADPEVYTDQLPQTAASDLHALAATLHFCVTGQPPAIFGSKLQRDSLAQVLVRLHHAHPNLRYPPALVGAIDRALHPDPSQWPQSVAQFRDWLAAGQRAATLHAAPIHLAPETPPASEINTAATSPTPSRVEPPEAPAAGAGAAEPFSAEPLSAETAAAQARARPSPTSPPADQADDATKSEEQPHIEFFPGIGQRPGIDATPRTSTRSNWTEPSRLASRRETTGGARAKRREAGASGFAASRMESRFDSRFEDSRLDPPASRFGAAGPGSRFDSVFGEDTEFGASVFGEVRRPPPAPSRLWPWAVAAGVLGLAGLTVWKLQDQNEYDRMLVELAKNAPSFELAPGASASGTVSDAEPPAAATVDPASAAMAATAAAVATDATATLPPEPTVPDTPTPPSANTPRNAATSRQQSSRQVAEVSLPSEPTSAGPAAPTATAEPPAPAVAPKRSATSPTPTARTESAGPRSPREACGSRTQFALYRCMETQCDRARWSRHPSCIRFRSSGELGE